MQNEPRDAGQTLRDALQAHGQRYTPQRAAVYEVLAASRSHPNAEEVYGAVREALPGISMATVYKSLEALVGCGLALKLAYADGSARYDGQMEPHHHARCDGCGRVFDVAAGPEQKALEVLKRGVAGFTVTDLRVELSGMCSDCSDSSVPRESGIAARSNGSRGPRNSRIRPNR